MDQHQPPWSIMVCIDGFSWHHFNNCSHTSNHYVLLTMELYNVPINGCWFSFIPYVSMGKAPDHRGCWLMVVYQLDFKGRIYMMKDTFFHYFLLFTLFDQCLWWGCLGTFKSIIMRIFSYYFHDYGNHWSFGG